MWVLGRGVCILTSGVKGYSVSKWEKAFRAGLELTSRLF